GHSLLAITLIERMRVRGLHADVRALFGAPTLAAFSSDVRRDASRVEVPPNGILPGCTSITPDMIPLVALQQEHVDRIVASVPGGAANIQDIYPLAPLQEGILFHYMLGGEGDTYLLSSLLALDSREVVDRFTRALER